MKIGRSVRHRTTHKRTTDLYMALRSGMDHNVQDMVYDNFVEHQDILDMENYWEYVMDYTEGNSDEHR